MASMRRPNRMSRGFVDVRNSFASEKKHRNALTDCWQGRPKGKATRTVLGGGGGDSKIQVLSAKNSKMFEIEKS